MAVKFSSVFEPFLNRKTKDFGNCDLKKCELDIEKRSLDIELYSEKYIKKEVKDELCTILKDALKVTSFKMALSFSKECFCVEACRDICEQLKMENVMLNGYFNKAVYNLKDDELEIVLAYGGLAVIQEIGFTNKFTRKVMELFGKEIKVSFSGQTQDIEMTLPEEPAYINEQEIPLPDEEPIKPKKVTAEPIPVSADGLPEFLYDVQLFYGKKLDKNFIRMIDIIPLDSGKLAIAGWGEVFNFEVKDINTKRGPRKIVTFALSDKTNSIYCKMFMTEEEMDSIKPVKDGAIIVFNGNYSLDDFTGQHILEPKAMATAKMVEEKDEYPEKRVELHCHTNMSAKDAVSPAGTLIKRAFKWGHKAIAITDHGVVQSYPAIAEAVNGIRKNGGEFKAIYGVESYFVDDTKGEADVTKLKSYHQIILVKNLVGLKNLYQLVSKAHLDDFYKRPLTRKSEIEKHREGLILGSACEAGELYDAVVRGKSDEELLEIARFYDYLEIQPIGNNEFMVRESVKPDKVSKKGVVTPNMYKHVTSVEVIKDFNRKIVEIADKLGLPVVATGDVHFAAKEDEILRKILMAAQGYEDFDKQAPLYLKTTSEMLEDFSYFGDRAKEFVIDNPNKIADMVSDDVVPVPAGNYPPVIEGSDELLRNLCWERANKMYCHKGEINDIVKKRLEKELNSIINNGFSIMYISAQKLVKYSEDHGYLVGSRGSVGSSFAATMAGISEVNPLPPHYYCPKCQWNKFFSSAEVGSGFDLPEKNCPECNTPLNRDGHDIPFETFLGFKGDKVPDIDLNFSDEFQSEVQKYTETLFGKENVFKAGTISTIAEKTAFGYVKAYCELKGIVLSKAEMERLAKAVENAKIKATTGQHPAGMIIVPRDKTIYDFCPIQHPADDPKSDILTTHFDFHSIHDTILKLDELGHVVPTTYKYLEEYTGISVNDISMSDPDVYSLFTSTKALGVTPEQIESQTGTFCIPEFGTAFVRGMLVDCKPKNFADLLQISGLSHGTDVWLGNAKDLIDQGICTISNVIGTRDNIMVYLINQGMDEGRAFKITETVRKGLVAKGKVSKEDWEQMENDMRAVNVPEWYIGSCKKIKYMFPKAHAAAYVISALRLCWYKVHKPLEFYCAYFTARPEDVDAPIIMQGHEAVKRYIRETKAKGKEASKKELDVLDNMYIFNELMCRGIKVLPIDLEKSHAVKFLPEKDGMRLPFCSISGMGDKAAYDVYEAAQRGGYVSVEDFQVESGVSKAVIQSLVDLGVMKDLPDTNQMSMF